MIRGLLITMVSRHPRFMLRHEASTRSFEVSWTTPWHTHDSQGMIPDYSGKLLITRIIFQCCYLRKSAQSAWVCLPRRIPIYLSREISAFYFTGIGRRLACYSVISNYIYLFILSCNCLHAFRAATSKSFSLSFE